MIEDEISESLQSLPPWRRRVGIVVCTDRWLGHRRDHGHPVSQRAVRVELSVTLPDGLTDLTGVPVKRRRL